MRKLAAALACRNQGSRLYGKPLQNLDSAKGVTVLHQIVSCLKGIDCLGQIVLGISEGNHNLAFMDYAKRENLDFIVGDEKDVLQRLIQCAEKAQASDVFRMTTESPFPFFELIESGWKSHQETNSDATFLDNVIDGCGFEIIKTDALRESHAKGGERHRSELCTLYIREHKNDFSIYYLPPPQELSRKDIRFTIDYPEDLIVCREVYQRFIDRAPFIPLRDAVRFMDRNPDLKSLTAPYCAEGYRKMYL
jgi:spore coat polysaccharide biosynthesis protein SpsF